MRLNRFALSLKQPSNRATFLADPDAFMNRWDLTERERSLVEARDWTGLLAAGGHLQAILKLAATLGLNLYHIGAHNCGVDAHQMMHACPRRVVSDMPHG
nr:hypothetical protein [Sphingomonas chungangi]